mgnify:CR=1 FL=1
MNSNTHAQLLMRVSQISTNWSFKNPLRTLGTRTQIHTQGLIRKKLKVILIKLSSLLGKRNW